MLPPGCDARPDRDGLRSHLNGGVWVGHQVVIPVRVERAASLRAENGEALTNLLAHERTDPLHAALRALMVQQQHRGVRERAADVAAIRAELLDDLRVEIADGFCHVLDLTGPRVLPFSAHNDAATAAPWPRDVQCGGSDPRLGRRWER
jgi:hypothetical protein